MVWGLLGRIFGFSYAGVALSLRDRANAKRGQKPAGGPRDYVYPSPGNTVRFFTKQQGPSKKRVFRVHFHTFWDSGHQVKRRLSVVTHSFIVSDPTHVGLPEDAHTWAAVPRYIREKDELRSSFFMITENE